MTDTYNLTIQDVQQAADALASRWGERVSSGEVRSVYGVPRGGWTPAAMVAGTLGLPLTYDPTPSPHVLAVDDLVDSGATARPYLEAGTPFDALYRKSWSPTATPLPVPGDRWVVFPWEDPGPGGPTDAVTRLLEWVGEDPTRPGLIDTPHRVTKAWAEMTEGYRQDPAAILERTFPDRCDEMVLVTGIDFVSLCEHHVLPFTGVAHVGYLPGDEVVGLSKIPRLVHAYARRLQVQERLTRQIADALMTHLKPKGVGVVVSASHACMTCRGVRLPNTTMTTSSLLGKFRDNGTVRSEFLSLVKQ